MHIFPALIGKLRRDVTDDKELLRDWDFPFIHHTVGSDSGCLEVSVIMVYCAAFARLEKTCSVSTVIRTREGAALGYPGVKISLKEDDVPTLFPAVEAILMPPIRRTDSQIILNVKHGLLFTPAHCTKQTQHCTSTVSS